MFNLTREERNYVAACYFGRWGVCVLPPVHRLETDVLHKPNMVEVTRPDGTTDIRHFDGTKRQWCKKCSHPEGCAMCTLP